MLQRLADYVFDRLSLAGLECCFLVNGRGVLHLTDALARSGLRAISCHHEQAAGFAALALAKYRKDFGCCLVSTGCAAANALTPLLCAWQDEVPLIVISGQHNLKESNTFRKLPVRTFGQQETDIIAVAAPWCKYAVQISDPAAVGQIMDRVMHEAKSGRPGPVWIDIPLDVQNMRVDPDVLLREEFVDEKPDVERSAAAADEILSCIYQAKRPLMLLGTELHWSQAEYALTALIEKLQLPVVYEPGACDLFGRAYDLSVGAVGAVGGSRAGNLALQNCDLLLCLGSKLNSQLTGDDPAKFARAAKIIAQSIDDTEFLKDGPKLQAIYTLSALDLIKALLKAADHPADCVDFINYCQRLKRDFPLSDKYCLKSDALELYSFAAALSAVLPKANTALIVDAGLEELIVPSTVELSSGQQCIQVYSQGCMGFALPAVSGVSEAEAEDVVVVVGDGSVMFNLQELQTIKGCGYKSKIFVINNNGYSIIRKRQHDLFRSRTLGNDSSDGLTLPDWEKTAAAFDLPYVKLSGKADLVRLQEILSRDEAVFCEVVCSPEQAFVHSSYGRDKHGRFVRRGLEDQSPFIPEDELQEHMLIEIIDR